VFGVRVQLLDDLAQHRIRLSKHTALDPDTHLRAAVAAEHGPVLDQGHVQSEPCGGNRRAAARRPAADNYQIEPAGLFGLAGKAEQFSAKHGQGRQRVGRAEVGVVAQHNRVAAPLKTRQILQP
jgi:hypothetical protein